jgi:large subunit ribosomal protein L24
MVTSGSFKGQIGEIVRVITKSDQVLVKGVNLHTKHIKPTRTAPQGGIITKEMPLHMSKVSPVVDGKPVRVGFRTEADGSKVRVARHAGKELKVLGVVHGPRTGGGAPAAPAAKAKAPKAEKPKAEKAPKAEKPAKAEKTEKAPKVAKKK